jgi:hypothetical protein
MPRDGQLVTFAGSGIVTPINDSLISAQRVTATTRPSPGWPDRLMFCQQTSLL